MTSTATIPASAHAKYLPLRLIGAGEDGIVVLAVPKSGPQTLQTCTALKIVKGNRIGAVPPKLLDDLKALRQRNVDAYPLVNVVDYSPLGNWYCMDYVRGCNVLELREAMYRQDGFPPFLVFHIFVEIMQAQLYLQANGLCHRDLSHGGNVMLSPPNGGNGLGPPQTVPVWPKIVLVDIGGVKEYNAAKAVEHVLGLVRFATDRASRVPNRWREGLDEAGLVLADGFYSAIQENSGTTLESVWATWEKEARRLKQLLWDKKAQDKFLEMISKPLVLEGGIKELVQTGGMDMEVEMFM